MDQLSELWAAAQEAQQAGAGAHGVVGSPVARGGGSAGAGGGSGVGVEETLRAEVQEVEARLLAKDEMLKRCQVCGGIVFSVRARGGSWACTLIWHIVDEKK